MSQSPAVPTELEQKLDDNECTDHDYSDLYEGIEGLYECYKYKNDGQNGYHFVNVLKQDNGTYIWKNLCTEWTLIPTNDGFVFKVGKDCVYYDWGYHEMKFKTEQNMVVCGYGPHNELFQKVRKFSDNYYNMAELKKNKNNNNNDIKENNETEGCDTNDNNDNNGTVINKSETFTWKGGKCGKAKQIGRVSILDNFIVSFSLVIHGKTCDSWESILMIGNNDAERSPGFWLYPKSNRLHVRLSDINDYNTGYDPSIELKKNTKYNIKFECINKTIKLHINGKLKVLNDDVIHLTRFRAPIWCGNKKWMPANATVADLKITSYI